MISKETQEPDVILPASMERSEVREMKRGELMRRVTLLHLLAAICETFGSECLSDNTQILLFVKVYTAMSDERLAFRLVYSSWDLH